MAMSFNANDCSASATSPVDIRNGSRNAPELEADEEGSSFADSGYSSLGSSARSVSTLNKFSPNSVIVRQDSLAGPTRLISAKTALFGPRTQELLLFPDAHIPDDYQDRFLDLVRLYDRSVKNRLKPKFMAWKLKVLGENEISKRPFIVVLCDPNSTKKIQKFFNKREIREQCEDIPSLPSLPVLVVASAPTKLGSSVPLVLGPSDVFCDYTTCGEGVQIVHEGKTTAATIGGVLKIVVDGRISLFGMTAGHLLEESEDDEMDFGDDDNDSLFSQDSDDSEGDDSEWEEEEGDTISGINPAETGFSSTPHTVQVPINGAGGSQMWSEIGHLVTLKHSTRAFRYSNLDWGLIQVNLVDQQRLKMNFVKASPSSEAMSAPEKREIKTMYHHRNGIVCNRTVIYQPGREPTYLRGKINTTPSYMHQSPSGCLARVYTMSCDSSVDRPQPGDCGSWVVDAETHAVYGHIVAADVFGDIYVIPFEDTIEQILEVSNVESVSLPLQRDFMAVESVNTSSRAATRSERPSFDGRRDISVGGTASCIGGECGAQKSFQQTFQLKNSLLPAEFSDKLTPCDENGMDYCFACDGEVSNGDPYCSQACRLMDLRQSSSSSSPTTMASSNTPAGSIVGPDFALPPPRFLAPSKFTIGETVFPGGKFLRPHTAPSNKVNPLTSQPEGRESHSLSEFYCNRNISQFWG
ncbi:hypothetical protein ABW19_dt0202456 [Dactylella cylindrospora]|nr:hypothetical protein ABW19_dt0202456 [Dactylella cylindrospora]